MRFLSSHVQMVNAAAERKNQIAEQAKRLWRNRLKMSTSGNAGQQQHGAANRQLPARDNHGRLSFSGEFADDCAAAGRCRCNKHKALTGQRDTAAQSVQRTQRDNQHANKAQDTAHAFGRIQPIIRK